MNDREHEELEEVLAVMYESERTSYELFGGCSDGFKQARMRIEELLGDDRVHLDEPEI